MSNSSLVSGTYLAAEGNYNKGRNGKKICKITPHHAAGVLSAVSLAKIFQNPSRKASANYCIGNDGQIVLSLDESNRAWTSSSPSNDYQAVTIEISNSSTGGNWPISDAAMNSLINLCVDICKRNGIKSLNFTGDANGNFTMHKMFAATACPGPYLESKMSWIAEQVNAKLGSGSSTPVTPTTSFKVGDRVKVKSGAKSYTGQSIASFVFNNVYTIDELKGDRAVLDLTGICTAFKTSDLIKQGSSSTTESTKPTEPAKPTTPAKKPVTDAIVNAVIRGDYGNGDARKKKLEAEGYNYSEVQSAVNDKLAGKSTTTSNKKSIDEIAKEVIRGDWGNGTDRKNRLTAAGYDYSEVQARVNQMLS